MKHKILVTGAAGFIGSHLVEYLLGEGHEVRAMVRYDSRGSRGNLEYLPAALSSGLEIITGDLKDPDFCHRAVEGCTYVFHLGALIAIPYSYVNPMDYIQTNVVGTANLLNAARKSTTLERFVHTSTSEVYGTARFSPITELHPLQPQSPYSASKIGADNFALSYFLSFDMPITVIRPFNTFGPRQSARAVIPAIISQLVAGKEVKLGSLEPKRDFLYVKDTARGFWHVGTHAATKGEVVNLGTGRTITIGQLYEIICEMTGSHPTITTDSDRIRPGKSEVFHLECDATKAKSLTGWAPSFTLEEGLGETIAFIRDKIASFRPEVYAV
jgi:NAD dependent epimerase/dehydratase